MGAKRLPKQEEIDWISSNGPKKGESTRAWAERAVDIPGCPRETPGALRALLLRIKDKGLRNVREAEGDKNVKFEYDEAKGAGLITYTGPVPIYTVDDLLKVADIDLEKFAVRRIECNNWPTTMKGPDKKPIQVQNFQVKAVLEPKYGIKTDWAPFMKEIDKACRKAYKIETAAGKRRDLVVACGDFHLGASVDNLVRTDRFDIDVLVSRLMEIAHHVNGMKSSAVHIVLLGDYIETWTGLNHLNSWKSANIYGAKAVITLHQVMLRFLLEINNLRSIRMVSGNHDRVSISKEVDQVGEVGHLLAYMLGLSIGQQVDIRFHPMVLNNQIDGISYVQAHGDKPFSQQETSKLLYEHGTQGKYNVFLRGHKHTERILRATKSKVIDYEDHQVVLHDEMDYRSYTVRPIFTGNFYSEQLGFSASAGANLFWNNGRGKPHMMDLLV